MSQLDAELEHADEETALSPQMLLLEQLRITPEKQLKPMEFLFHLYGKPCFPRRELVAITGKAKSGKTFVTSMLMAVGSLTPDPIPVEGAARPVARGRDAVQARPGDCRWHPRPSERHQHIHDSILFIALSLIYYFFPFCIILYLVERLRVGKRSSGIEGVFICPATSMLLFG